MSADIVMPQRTKKPFTERTVLREIERIVGQANAYQSRQSGKKFYRSQNLPTLLQSFMLQNGLRPAECAQQFGMSTGTLKQIVNGGALSENMLFRIRNSLERIEQTLHVRKRKGVYIGNWRDATAKDVQDAIAVVSERLVFLKRVVEKSNFLHSPESPIDKIQVKQLVALLAATVEVLQAPFVDTKQARGFFQWLRKLATSAIEKGVEKKVTEAIGDAVDAGTILLQELSDKSGITDVGDIIK